MAHVTTMITWRIRVKGSEINASFWRQSSIRVVSKPSIYHNFDENKLSKSLENYVQLCSSSKALRCSCSAVCIVLCSGAWGVICASTSSCWSDRQTVTERTAPAPSVCALCSVSPALLSSCSSSPPEPSNQCHPHYTYCLLFKSLGFVRFWF